MSIDLQATKKSLKHGVIIVNNFSTTILLLILTISCVQNEPSSTLTNSSNDSAGGLEVAHTKKSFKNREFLGFVNLIAHQDLNLTEPVSDFGEFESIVVYSVGKSISMTYGEFYERGGIVNLPVQKKGVKVSVKIFFNDGSHRVINI